MSPTLTVLAKRAYLILFYYYWLLTPDFSILVVFGATRLTLKSLQKKD